MKTLRYGACFGLFASLGVFVFSCAGEAPADGEPEPGTETDLDRTVICHLPEEGPDKARTIEISSAEVEEHLANGDRLGPCAGECTLAGHPCRANEECCSEACQEGVCEHRCKPHGAACEMNAQCCGKNCSDGVCERPCKARKSRCKANSECCSGTCARKKCGAI